MALVVRELGLYPYRKALALQESLVERKLSGDPDDYLLLLEHPPVYTLGRGAAVADLLGADRELGIEAVRTGRGGGVTFHGPGQLVSYPIVALDRLQLDVSTYVRRLEAVLIEVCAGAGIAASRRQGAPGAWVGEAKIGSVGIAVRRWIAFHGVALNVSTDLGYFARIVTCRMPGMRLTSMEQELGCAPDAAAVRRLYVDAFVRVFDCTPLVERQVA